MVTLKFACGGSLVTNTLGLPQEVAAHDAVSAAIIPGMIAELASTNNTSSTVNVAVALRTSSKATLARTFRAEMTTGGVGLRNENPTSISAVVLFSEILCKRAACVVV